MLKRIQCWECGRLLGTSVENPTRTYCPDCRPRVMERSRKETKVWLEVHCRHLVDIALEELEDAGADVYGYRDAYAAVYQRLVEGPMRFDDVQAVKAMLVLEYSGIPVETLKQVLNRRADFVLPKRRVILMVDTRVDKQEIQSILDWEARLPERLGKDWVVAYLNRGDLDRYQDDFEAHLEVLIKRSRTRLESMKKRAGTVS
jgi:hypothetical protein